MIKVAAFTDHKITPSRRFRVEQLKRPLLKHGIKIQEYLAYPDNFNKRPNWAVERIFIKLLTMPHRLNRAKTADIAIVQRNLFGKFYTFESFVPNPKLLDIDDAVWLNQAKNYSFKIAKHFDGVIAGNKNIAKHFEKYGVRTWIVPTAVDTQRFRPILSKKQKEEIIVGWMGTKDNLYVLRKVERPIKNLMKKYKDVKLLICSDSRPQFNDIPDSRYLYIPWSSKIEVDVLNMIDIGIMPLDDTEWNRHKCSYKMLLYMAVGKPVVVSPIGMNNEILNQGSVGFGPRSESEWFDSLQWLYLHRKEASEMGQHGRLIVEKNYSTEIIASLISKIINEIV
ncbi:MAG: glycosyltransferase family 4 protein [candidate division KSB1 bacterium]|nr:glycosyltransferase family 4 protein [candidate division KSB1 bacterium]